LAYSYPDYISDFNVLVGGRAGGQAISIIGEEWGQDSQRLARALRARDVTSVFMTGASRMTRAELTFGGIATATMRCDGSVPLGAHYVVRARDRVRRDCALWSRDRKPLFDINGHLFVYRLE
jgi:hypothetical protein